VSADAKHNHAADAPACSRETLARAGGYQVELCSCGSVYVTAGPVTLRFTPEAYRALAAVLDAGRARLPAAPLSAPRN
jgi:hypothetical protein